MTVTELMAGKTPDPSFQGVATNDDFVLAVDVSEDGDGADPKEYEVVQVGITSHAASVESQTQDTQYIRTGQTTTKTGAQRIFTITGDRFHGDKFQDFATSLKTMFGVGQSVIRKYVYFSMLTGKGEQGKASVVANEDQGGDAGSNASIAIEIKSVEKPTEYTFSAV